MGIYAHFYSELDEYWVDANTQTPDLTIIDVKKVGLENRLNHKPSELSGGERQRVAIARAMISEPTCLLADEPTGNLDANNAQDILDLIIELNHNKRTALLIVTHDLSIANKMDRKFELINKALIEI